MSTMTGQATSSYQQSNCNRCHRSTDGSLHACCWNSTFGTMTTASSIGSMQFSIGDVFVDAKMLARIPPPLSLLRISLCRTGLERHKNVTIDRREDSSFHVDRGSRRQGHRAGAVPIEGDAGTGKSRVLSEFPSEVNSTRRDEARRG